MAPVKILLVDDNENFLTAAQGFLSSGNGINVVGIALSGHHAINQVKIMRPHIIFMDISMPGMNGIEATQRIKSMPDPPLVVLLTMYDCIEYRCHASAAGADAFLLKEKFAISVFEMIEALANRVSKLGCIASAESVFG